MQITCVAPAFKKHFAISSECHAEIATILELKLASLRNSTSSFLNKNSDRPNSSSRIKAYVSLLSNSIPKRSKHHY